MKKTGVNRMILFSGFFCGCIIGSALFAQPLTSVWDGVYSEEQASRGRTVYREVCVGCHGEDLRGDNQSPSLVGVSFMFLWEQRSVGALLDSIQADMPPTDPDSLSSQRYLDVLAYIMQANGFPAGEAELAGDPRIREQILIVAKPI